MTVVSSPVPVGERRFELVASEGTAICARLRGRGPIPGLFIADAIELDVGSDPVAAHRAFARAFALACVPSGEGAGTSRPGEILVIETPESIVWRDALREAGFRETMRKVFVERRLDDALPMGPAPALDDWRLRSLAGAGEHAFNARMAAASEGDPFEERRSGERDLEREWLDLVESAGTRFDPTRWWLVDDARGPIGVVLPQRVNESTGTLFYVGVVPSRRGAGLGRRLHALGLALLARDGARRYVGSTDVRNAAMRAVFERNGAPVTGTEAYFRAEVPPA